MTEDCLAEIESCGGWVFHFSGTPSGGLELVYSGQGIDTVPLALDGGRWTISGTLDLIPDTLETALFGRRLQVQALQLSFPGADLEHLTAEGTGVLAQGSDDTPPSQREVSFTFTAVTDRNSPTATNTCGASSGCAAEGEQRNPLDVTGLRPSEALAPGATAHLLAPDGTRVDASPVETAGVVALFDVARILPSGTSWEWVASGEDLGGNPFSAATPLTLPPSPAFAPTDLEGAVELVDVITSTSCDWEAPPSGSLPALGSLPPLSGSTSFFVPAGTTALLRLARPAGTSTVRVRLQKIYGEYGVAYPLRLRAGVVGGTGRAETLTAWWDPSRPTVSTPITGAGLLAWANDAEDVVLSIPDAGDEVLLELQGVCDRHRSAPYETAAWVESVQLE